MARPSSSCKACQVDRFEQDVRSEPGRGKTAGRVALITLSLLAAAAALAFFALELTGVLDDPPTVEPAAVAEAARSPEPAEDPFAYTEERRRDFEARATLGYSHPLYAKSPGGVVATAERVNAFREQIERSAKAHDLDPDLIEAIVFLESAGRQDVIAGTDPAAASGLAQILASTGIDLLGMPIELARSQAITAELNSIAVALPKLRDKVAGLAPKKARDLVARIADLERRVPALIEQRRQVDPRFDPAAALDAMGRYLEIARERFGREDLAVVSYHMGIGNLTTAIERYTDVDVADERMAAFVADADLDYARLFFDSSPLTHAAAWEFLASLGDDSSTYLWRVYAARRIMELWRQDPGELGDLAVLHLAKATAEEVFHPEEVTDRFLDVGELEEALDDGNLVPIPAGDEYGFEISDQLGELAASLGVDRSLYASLRPEALAALIYMSARVDTIAGGGKLTVTSAVRDLPYQEALTGVNPEATSEYSLHTTGYSFDILRKYRGEKQAEAFQFVLDRLRALAVIDYAVEPASIHVTVSNGARPLTE